MSHFSSRSYFSSREPSYSGSNSSYLRSSRVYDRYSNYSESYPQLSAPIVFNDSSLSQFPRDSTRDLTRDFTSSREIFRDFSSPKEYFPSKKNWPLFQHFVQSHGSPYLVTAANVLYHIYLIRNPPEVLEKAWTIALRYWKEPFDVFERDMRWILEGNSTEIRPHNVPVPVTAPTLEGGSVQPPYVQDPTQNASIPGELTPLDGVRTFVDERLIYRQPSLHHSHANSAQHHQVGPQFEYTTVSDKSVLSPIAGKESRGVTIMTESQRRREDKISSPQSSSSAESWLHRNVTPRRHRESKGNSEVSPSSKRSLFMDPQQNATNSRRSVVVQYDSVFIQTDPIQPDSSEIAVLQAEVQSKDDQINKLTRDIARERERVRSLEQELEQTEIASGLENDSELKNQIRDLKTTIRRLERELESTTEDSELLTSENDRLKGEVHTMKVRCRSLEDRLNSQQGNLDENASQERKALERKIALLESEKDSLLITNQGLETKVRALQSLADTNMNSNASELALTHSSMQKLSLPESILSKMQTRCLHSLSLQFYIHLGKDNLQSTFKEVLQKLINDSVILQSVRSALLNKKFYADEELGEFAYYDVPLVLGGICIALLHNNNGSFPTIWSIDESTKINIEIIEKKAPITTPQSLKSFIYQIACNLGKEAFAEKWLQCLEQVFEVNTLDDLMIFSQWHQLQNYISLNAIQLIQSCVYRLNLSKKSIPDKVKLEANMQLYALKIRQFFHYSSDMLQNIPLLDKDTINIGIRDLSKKYACKNVLKDVNQNFLKVISSDNTKLLTSHKIILFYGLKGAPMHQLAQNLPAVVGFTPLTEIDLQNIEDSLQRLRMEAQCFQFLPCSLTISNLQQFVKHDQLRILEAVDKLRNVFLFLSIDDVHILDGSVLKRISFKFHFGSIGVRERLKLLRTISASSGIQIETSEQRNMFLAVTSNFTLEPLKSLIDLLPIMAIDRAINEWTTEFVVPYAENIAKQFGITIGQYSAPLSFKAWADLSLPLFVSPLQESMSFQGLLLIHLGQTPVTARFKGMSQNGAQANLRPDLEETSVFSKSPLLVEHTLLPQKLQSIPTIQQSLIAILIQFGIVEQVDFCTMIDATSCIEKCGSLNDDKVIEYIDWHVMECQSYDRSILLFDLDGLCVCGEAIWDFIIHTCLTKSKHAHALSKKHQSQAKALWIGCITRSDDINLSLEKALKFPRNELSFNYEKSQLLQMRQRPSKAEGLAPALPSTMTPSRSEKKEPCICKTCGLQYMPDEDELCCFHPGELVEIDRQTGEVNTTDKRTALLQEFVFKERSNILIWVCCYNSIGHEGCKKMKHSSTIDKKAMFVEEAQDNYEMIRVNPHLFRMRKEGET